MINQTIDKPGKLAPDQPQASSLTEAAMTARKQARQRRASNEAARALGEVAGSVAHEVRNPLNGILVALELLDEQFSRPPDLDECRKHLSRIGRQAGRIKVLMDDLLKIRQPVTLENVTPVSVSDLCRDTLSEWQNCNQTGRDIGFKVAEDAEKLLVNADSFRLAQALTNLLGNASDNTPAPGCIVLHIDATPGAEARIRVIDEGVGIPDGKLGEVFSPFYTSRREGTGLGLNLVKQIVEKHDGTVTLRNNDNGSGCTAEIILPLA